jgi:hypothetical protein
MEIDVEKRMKFNVPKQMLNILFAFGNGNEIRFV